jgi:hypothetical protein
MCLPSNSCSCMCHRHPGTVAHVAACCSGGVLHSSKPLGPYCSTCNDQGCCDECETHVWVESGVGYVCEFCGQEG